METTGIAKLKLSAARLGVLAVVLWGVFLADRVLPIDFNRWGIIPRELGGIWGIFLSPFLHANLSHLLSNFLPLMILLTLLVATQRHSWWIALQIVLLGGLLLWVFGRPAVHVGASGLIYGLIAYLMAAGFRQGRFGPAIAALLVGFLYGGTLLSGVLPTVGEHVSWDGHLTSAVAGGILGYFSTSSIQAAAQEPTDLNLS
ncbi:MAG: rhomboid family intramembrane serine protease [Planctomycetota bacterium]|jgi:membrane associated rhomboid family serine protease|nr:rhomboid family intramembrane serine protease [Planctomycetota bacterium]